MDQNPTENQGAEQAPAKDTTQEAPASDTSKVMDGSAAKVQELSEKNADLQDKLLRAVAETENVRRRLTKEIEDVAHYSISNFAHDMTEGVENLYRAMDSVPKDKLAEDPTAQSIYQGVEMTVTIILKNMEKHGVKRLYPLDQEFDHNFHQALGQVENTGKPSGTIVQVIQAGYVIKDRLLKPAMVMVAK